MRDRVKITVYNLNGGQIAVLKDASENAGDHSVKWGGKNSRNQTVSGGIYLCRIQAGKYRKTIRMLFLK
jgi:flagellar hook assembly protein FlgD